MIYLLYGPDSYRVREAYREIRDGLAAEDEMLASNTTVLDGREVTPQELLAHATSVPFLAAHRLVVVEGLLRALGEIKGGRRKKAAADDPLEPWRQAAAQLGDKAAVPETTTLVLLEGKLDQRNPAFTLFAPIARTVEYTALGKGDLPDWIASAAKARGVKLAPRAVAALAQIIGPDLWMLSTELDRLAAYADGDVVDAETVSAVVSAAQETRIWDLSDAVVAGDEGKALRAMRALLADGEPAPLLLFMLARQLRQLAIVKDLRERRARQDEVLRTSGVPGFKLGAMQALASRYSWEAVRAAYRRTLVADLNVKRGLQDDESALQLLIHDLCALAPRNAARPSLAR